MRRLERGDQLWEVWRDGVCVVTRFGGVARGASIRQVVRELATPALADAAAERAVASKRAAGFVEVDAATEGGRRLPRHPALEQAIWDRPDDLDAWQVYVDWLGESVARSPRVAVAAAELAVARRFGRPMPEGPAPPELVATDLGDVDADAPPEGYGYRHGFWRTLRVGHLPDLDTDAARFLEHVTLLSGPDEFSEPAYAEALDRLAKHAPPGLRSVTLSDTEYQLSWIDLGRFALFERCPRLERVTLVAGSVSLGDVQAPALRSFTLQTTGLKRQVVQALVEGELPALEALELWVGDPDRSDVRPEDLAALLARPWPALRSFGVRNAPRVDALVDVLAASPVLPQLTALDLSLGTLTAAGARRLVERAAAFAHLERLDLSSNLLDDAASAAVTAALPRAVVEDQRAALLDGEDDDPATYVTVWE